jgi:hypothetical protein
MIFMPSIWTLIAGVSVVTILSAFQWWLSGHARRFARMHRSTARSFENRGQAEWSRAAVRARRQPRIWHGNRPLSPRPPRRGQL